MSPGRGPAARGGGRAALLGLLAAMASPGFPARVPGAVGRAVAGALGGGRPGAGPAAAPIRGPSIGASDAALADIPAATWPGT